MSHDLCEIAPLYALGLAESKEVDYLLSSADEALFAEIEDHQNVAGELAALYAKQPPASVKSRLMEQIAPAQAAATRLSMPESVVALVRASEGKWLPTPYPGITVKPLFSDSKTGNQSLLVRMAPGSVYPSHHHVGLEHSLVLEGDAVFSDHTLHAGDYEVGQADADHSSIRTKGGCLVFIIRNQADRIHAL